MHFNCHQKSCGISVTWLVSNRSWGTHHSFQEKAKAAGVATKVASVPAAPPVAAAAAAKSLPAAAAMQKKSWSMQALKHPITSCSSSNCDFILFAGGLLHTRINNITRRGEVPIKNLYYPCFMNCCFATLLEIRKAVSDFHLLSPCETTKIRALHWG